MSVETVKRMVEEMHVEELEEILERDYLRKLSRYKLTNESFRKKYGMTYEEFERGNIVAEQKYSWDVESDAQEWEMANDGINTCLRNLGSSEVILTQSLKMPILLLVISD